MISIAVLHRCCPERAFAEWNMTAGDCRNASDMYQIEVLTLENNIETVSGFFNLENI